MFSGTGPRSLNLTVERSVGRIAVTGREQELSAAQPVLDDLAGRSRLGRPAVGRSGQVGVVFRR